MGDGTGKGLHVLCYQHHREMSLEFHSGSEGALFRCQEPDCLIRYGTARGYFLDTRDKTTLEQEILPRVRCSLDKRLMYLAESQTRTRSYRLWKCPKCSASHTNEGASNEVEKKAGA